MDRTKRRVIIASSGSGKTFIVRYLYEQGVEGFDPDTAITPETRSLLETYRLKRLWEPYNQLWHKLLRGALSKCDPDFLLFHSFIDARGALGFREYQDLLDSGNVGVLEVEATELARRRAQRGMSLEQLKLAQLNDFTNQQDADYPRATKINGAAIRHIQHLQYTSELAVVSEPTSSTAPTPTEPTTRLTN